MNKQLLHFIVSKKGYTNEDIAKVLGISRGSYQARLNGSVQFTLKEMNAIRDKLRMTDAEVLGVFFAENVNY